MLPSTATVSRLDPSHTGRQCINRPLVSFVVPCYRLAHFLRECVGSILAQTYHEFEVIIMDDCSPDNTSEVALSMMDQRIRYVRNPQNLGHLHNYNKGVSLARGKYVWLISADDRLCVPYALQRFIDILERHPKVGFAFCPAAGLIDGQEAAVLKQFYHGARDHIYRGRRFLWTLVQSGGVASASVISRKECYETVSWFPLNVPHLGDVYMWSMWALKYDVAYVAEPMVAYRLHTSSMMQRIKQREPQIMVSDDLTVHWAVKNKLQSLGRPAMARKCTRLLASRYAFYIGPKPAPYSHLRLTPVAFEESLLAHGISVRERRWLRARVHARLGDRWYGEHDYALAKQYYWTALRYDRRMLATWIKYALVHLGATGRILRDGVGSARHGVRKWVLSHDS